MHSRGNGDAILGVPFVNEAAAPYFRVTSDQTAFPARLQPGDAATLTTRFVPTGGGVVAGEIRIPLIAPDGTTTYQSVPVAGTGVAGAATQETFDQPANPPLDVLLVVDDSASMADDVERVRANVPLLLHPLALGGADFRIAVTTVLYYSEPTNYVSWHWESWDEHPLVGHHTRCSWANRFVVRDGPDPAAMLACNAEMFLEEAQQVPTRPRPSWEAPLAAAARFFSAENLGDPARNGRFLRDEADLHVILIADEKDPERLPLDLHYELFRTLKQPGGAARVRISAVGINDDTCLVEVDGIVGDQPPTWEGTDIYMTIAEEMNGHFFPICEDDWSPFREQLGADVLEQRKRFYLAREPDPTTLSVCVRAGGAEDPSCVAQVQGVDYRYEPEGNMLVFSLAALPPAGARIEVGYGALCVAP